MKSEFNSPVITIHVEAVSLHFFWADSPKWFTSIYIYIYIYIYILRSSRGGQFTLFLGWLSPKWFTSIYILRSSQGGQFTLFLGWLSLKWFTSIYILRTC